MAHFNLKKWKWIDCLVNIETYIYYFWLYFHVDKCYLIQGIFQKNTSKALKYGIYRYLPIYEKIIRNLVSFYHQKFVFVYYCLVKYIIFTRYDIIFLRINRNILYIINGGE